VLTSRSGKYINHLPIQADGLYIYLGYFLVCPQGKPRAPKLKLERRKRRERRRRERRGMKGIFNQ